VTDSQGYYQSEGEVKARVRGFEDCTLPDSEFDHPSHLTVALAYLHLSRLSVPEATTRMRAALYRFLDHYGEDRGKYNETITLFWVKLVRGFLDKTDTARPLADIANEMIESFGSSRLIYDYYSKERLSSEEARKEWVEPDVKPLDF
jgi:hypothetical protein